MIEIKITMGDQTTIITPDSKVKLTLKDVVIILIALASATGWALDYFGVLSNQAHGQVIDPITKTEVESTYVKKEKLQDTVNLVEYRIQTLEKAVKSLEEQVVKNQDKTDDKLDKILDKISKP